MKPRTKIQKEVAKLFPKLPSITPKQRQYAEDKCHSRIGFYSSQQIWCAHCGRFYNVDVTPLHDVTGGTFTFVCPCCGEKLKVEKSQKRVYHEAQYYTILTTFRGWQVIRHFYVVTNRRKYEQETNDVEITEVVQMWINEKGESVAVARARQPSFFCSKTDNWCLTSDMEIRNERTRYIYNSGKYIVWANHIYPGGSILPKLKRNGFSSKAADKAMPPCELVKKLLTDNETEFLIKTGQYELAGYLKYKKDVAIGKYMAPIRICNRNGYIVKDASLYCDYIDLLEYFHLDTHSPRYVCPLDLNKEHDALLRRKERKEAEDRARKERLDAAKWEEEYRKMKGGYFGICFGNEHIQIAVIQSVADMAEEGLMLHHCVYSMGYYKKPDSLILSARDMGGKRLETIEINLKTFQIVQSRGLQNRSSPFHDEIVELVRANINKIRKAAG